MSRSRCIESLVYRIYCFTNIGSNTLDIFRTLERTSVKLVKVREDLEFLCKCPVFLRFKLPNNRLARSAEIADFFLRR